MLFVLYFQSNLNLICWSDVPGDNTYNIVSSKEVIKDRLSSPMMFMKIKGTHSSNFLCS